MCYNKLDGSAPALEFSFTECPVVLSNPPRRDRNGHHAAPLLLNTILFPVNISLFLRSLKSEMYNFRITS